MRKQKESKEEIQKSIESVIGVLDESSIQNILWFGVVWSIFEKECCKTDASIARHPDEFAGKADKFDPNLLNATWEYFSSRYIDKNGETTAKFTAFKFKKNSEGNSGEYKNFVKTVFKKKSKATAEEKIKALLYISFRLRNNLLHGSKYEDTNDPILDRLYDQEDNFYHANRLLLEFVKLKRNGNISDIAT